MATLPTTKLPPALTLEELSDLQKQLKDLNKGWVKLLCEKIKALYPNSEYGEINNNKIYNVFYGSANGAWKHIVVKNAQELKKQLEVDLVKELQT
ncbi:MAG: hypothetical protein IAF38_21095 [Bacteroidia bacterium]|nr:hypothetical protein [Bacteroidia bacterium]